MTTTPMGTCCELCSSWIRVGNKAVDVCVNHECPCHTAPPTYQQGGSSLTIHMEKELDFTEPPTAPLIPLDVIARIGTLDDTPTPNTGMEWDKDYGTRFEWRHDSTGAGYIWDNLGQQVWDEVLMKMYIERLLATQKSQLIAEVEDAIETTTTTFTKRICAPDGKCEEIVYVHKNILLAKLKGM